MSIRSFDMTLLMLLIFSILALGISASLTVIPRSESCHVNADSDLPEANCVLSDTRNPPFLANIRKGLKSAQSYFEIPDLPELLVVATVMTYSPGMSPSSRLDSFTLAGMAILRKRHSEPRRYTKYKLPGGPKWGQWSRYPGSPFDIDDYSIGRKFALGDIALSQDQALGILRQNSREGPWLAIELCVPRPGEALTYAFMTSHPTRDSFTYNLVSVNLGRVQDWSGRYQFCEDASPRPTQLEDVGTSTSSSIDAGSGVSAPAATTSEQFAVSRSDQFVSAA